MFLIGQGLDQHKLIKKDKSTIVLGGYKFQCNYKIKAVSDGDVVIHSICNAILGSIQGGDIGEYFLDTDNKNKNLDSKEILKFCLKKLNKAKIVNVDLTIQCENIILKDIKKQIASSLVKLLNCKKINVKATRFEHKSDLIACHSIVLVSK
ncbi:MAG: 2-C-methyl-D-erythritol 2,4-cyclodiphosphate synthase [Mycoplasmoidaceae bacterium]|nr:2-C-methyl-D-erythritol 2,4-cyclodiphosphate synthase [Mycoplasmoidaceae bacterium]